MLPPISMRPNNLDSCSDGGFDDYVPSAVASVPQAAARETWLSRLSAAGQPLKYISFSKRSKSRIILQFPDSLRLMSYRIIQKSDQRRNAGGHTGGRGLPSTRGNCTSMSLLVGTDTSGGAHGSPGGEQPTVHCHIPPSHTVGWQEAGDHPRHRGHSIHAAGGLYRQPTGPKSVQDGTPPDGQCIKVWRVQDGSTVRAATDRGDSQWSGDIPSVEDPVLMKLVAYIYTL